MESNPPAIWSLRLLLCPDLPDQASFHPWPASAAACQQSRRVRFRQEEKELRHQRREKWEE